MEREWKLGVDLSTQDGLLDDAQLGGKELSSTQEKLSMLAFLC